VSAEKEPAGPPADVHARAGFVDSHCHLTMDGFDGDREEVFARARLAGVGALLVVSASPGDAEKTVAFARSHPSVWATAGVHPHDAKDYDERAEFGLREALADPLAVAVGEIGLDYHYDRSPREAQRDAFRRQIRLALATGRPIVVHTREARSDTIRILEEESAPRAGGVFHCFTEDLSTAAWAVENGFLVSFSGVVTFRNADDLRAVARSVPLDRTLIETDAPFLAPVPLRGRRNEPSNVLHVAACLAELHGCTPEEVGRITADNFFRLFRTTAR